MAKEKTFTDGYIDGYQSIAGGVVPGIPSYSIPAGKTEYQAGYDRGRADAEERQAWREGSDK